MNLISMRSIGVLSGFVGFVLTAAMSASETPGKAVCANTDGMKRVAAVCRELTDDMKRADEFESRTKRDAPEGGGWSWIRLKFTGKMEENTIVLDLPELYADVQEIIFHMVDFSMEETRWSWDSPAVRVVQDCHDVTIPTVDLVDSSIPGIKAPRVGSRVEKVCLPRPEFYTERHEAILHVPRTSMSERRIALTIPQVRMRRETWILALPSLTLTGLDGGAGEAKEKSEQFQKEANAMVARFETYRCRFMTAYIDDFAEKLQELERQELDAVQARDRAAASSAPSVVSTANESINALRAAKVQVQAQLDALRQQAAAQTCR